MNLKTVELTLEFRCADGTSTEFYQADEQRVRATLRLLATPRLFAQPELVLASQHCVSVITTRTIDMILARTSAPLPAILPMNSPAGPVDIRELEPKNQDHVSSKAFDEETAISCAGGSPCAFRVEIHTMGGWKNTLEVRTPLDATVLDRRQTFAHIFHIPVIPFQLTAVGLGFINPLNLVRVTSYPPPDSLPETALPLELSRWLPSRLKNPAGLTGINYVGE